MVPPQALATTPGFLHTQIHVSMSTCGHTHTHERRPPGTLPDPQGTPCSREASGWVRGAGSPHGLGKFKLSGPPKERYFTIRGRKIKEFLIKKINKPSQEKSELSWTCYTSLTV